jgi:flagellar FliL protein
MKTTVEGRVPALARYGAPGTKPKVKAQKIVPAAKASKVELPVVEHAREDSGGPPNKVGGKRSLLIGVVVLLLLSGAGTAGWYFFGGDLLAELKQDEPAAANGETPAAEAKPAKSEPLLKPEFVSLDPFTVNLAEENGDHFLQAAIVFQVKDEQAANTLKLYLPIVRSRILLLLSSKHPSELVQASGKKTLAEQLMTEARAAIPGNDADRDILNCYFSSFVIQ